MDYILENWKDIVYSTGILASSLVLGFLAHFILIKILSYLGKKTQTQFIISLRQHEKNPLRLLIPLIFFSMFLFFTKFPDQVVNVLRKVTGVLFIVAVAWAIIKITFVIEDLILEKLDLKEKDNLRARKIYTQIQFFKKVVLISIGVIAVAIILMEFTKVREIGATILASAGVVGLIVGFAAQRTIGTFIAGLQIAITQPIRIDDVVIVENEWGRVEEINLTYVVVRIWDLRRLVLPINYFIEKPFQNWTRTSAQILGTVYIYTDYTVPVDAMREELYRVLKQNKLWDGQVWNLQVTNMNESTVELRALMSAPDASSAWDLRCAVREKLLDFIQKNYPHSLPRIRVELERGNISNNPHSSPPI